MKPRWILIILTILILWVVISRFTELEQLRNTLQQGQLGWMIVSLVSQALYFLAFTASYQAAFKTLDIHLRTRDLLPITLGSRFVNLVVPTGIAGGTAFANLIPEYNLNEITLDLMRHRRGMENGTMEFLFVSMFQWARERGYDTFNLGLSALSGVGESPGDPAIERVIHWAYEHVNQFYNFKGLHNFKEKFHPEWSPRYLIYPGVANLAQAWLAVIEANSGAEPLTNLFKRRR